MSDQWKEDFIKRAGFRYRWENLESWARRMVEQAQEELAAVTAERDSLVERMAMRDHNYDTLLQDASRIRDELAAAREDAERYRWLRKIGAAM